MISKNYILSKSTFLKGIQCPKALYLHKHHYRLKDAVSKEQQAIFDRGNKVGLLARQLFPGGKSAEPANTREFMKSVQKTELLIAQRFPVIYEAAVVAEKTLIFLDILVWNGESYDAYEVKSSLRISPTNIQDAKLQYFVLKNAGLPMRSFQMVYVNDQYEREDSFDLKSFFRFRDVTEECVQAEEEVRKIILQELQVLTAPQAPDVDTGPHCQTPYPCDFKGHCWSSDPYRWIEQLPFISPAQKKDFRDKGYKDVIELLNDKNLPPLLRMHLDSSLSNKPYTDLPHLKDFLKDFHYPLLFLDTESIMPAIPLFKGNKPFQAVPVQFAAYRLDKPGAEPELIEFLARPGDDPRKEFLKHFITACRGIGSLVVFDRASESSVIQQLIKEFPESEAELREINDRIADLMMPFIKRWFYHASFNGSCSLKTLVNFFFPEEGYAEMRISSGILAMAEYEKSMASVDLFHWAELEQHLLDYCRLDARALWKIWSKLQEIIPA